MKKIENFDCTQMISFEHHHEKKPELLGLSSFEKIGFDILLDENIRQVKKTYFQRSENEYFIELINKEFSGEFEGWVDFDTPPQIIVDFACEIIDFSKKNNLSKIRIFLTFFAEKNVTKDHTVLCNSDELLNAFFIMSKSNFDIWVDNLIINFISP
ncbi:hypothetical protein [Serratia sp. 2723]|uniref:hypothetical protein n=1 Tax=unclassified Serratia (in: enterobacteria) TaxID=2647522 RepID=UPI003D2295F7